MSKECFLQANPSLQPLHISTAKKLCASSRIELNQGLILCKFPSPTQVLLSGLYLPNYVSQQCLRTDLTKRVSNLPRGNCAEMKPSRPPNTQVTEKNVAGINLACDILDIWSEWWGDMTWPKTKTMIKTKTYRENLQRASLVTLWPFRHLSRVMRRHDMTKKKTIQIQIQRHQQRQKEIYKENTFKERS